MPSIRKTKTASGATAVQVVRYEQRSAGRQVVVLKHIGSGTTKEEIAALVEDARRWIEREGGQPSLFASGERRVLPLSTTTYLGVTHSFARETLRAVGRRCGLDPEKYAFILDFALMRLIEPTSKLRSIELLYRYFGVSYAERTVYRTLRRLSADKPAIEDIAVSCAARLLQTEFSLVLYDVTTLYFETANSDDLRRHGFSKDNQPRKPQIVIGLLVTKEGFPIGYEVFAGSTFEGHTMLPVLEDFAKRHNVATPTVVADAGMLSRENITELERRGLSYIVGARLKSSSPELIDRIDKALPRTDGATARITDDRGDLVVSYTAARYRKHKADLDRQAAKAEELVRKNEPGRRAMYVTRAGDDSYTVNQNLIEKHRTLLGVRGYHTNISADTLSNREVRDRYHDLWHVEQAFRMAKSDLAARPIFHYKEQAVRAHILVCFVALMMGKYMEITSGLSMRHIRDLLWRVTDAQMMDTATGEVFTLRSPVSEETRNLLRQLKLSY